jgi:hypothetical protein
MRCVQGCSQMRVMCNPAHGIVAGRKPFPQHEWSTGTLQYAYKAFIFSITVEWTCTRSVETRRYRYVFTSLRHSTFDIYRSTRLPACQVQTTPNTYPSLLPTPQSYVNHSSLALSSRPAEPINKMRSNRLLLFQTQCFQHLRGDLLFVILLLLISPALDFSTYALHIRHLET